MPDAFATDCATSADPLARALPSRREVMLEWLAGQPFVPPALGMAAGLWLDSAWHVPSLVAVLLFLLAGTALYCFTRGDGRRHLAMALAAVAVGAALHDAQFRRWPADHIVRYTAREPALVQLTGSVLTPPLIQQHNQGRITWIPELPRTRIVLEADGLLGPNGRIPVSGLVAVTVREPAPHIRAGDRLAICGWLHRTPSPANPDEMDWALKGRRNGLLVELSSAHAAAVRVLASSSGGPGLVTRIRQKASAAMLEQAFPGEVPGSRLLEALVLGQRSAIDPDLNQAFVNTGTVHYLSVSGAHMGMLASVVWMIGVVAGASRRTCALWAMVLLTAYATLCEPNAPIIRSAVMGDLLCLAVLLRRPVRAANWLAASAVLLLATSPAQLFEPGFQLSFMTLLGVFYLSPPVHRLGRRTLDWVLRRDDPLLSPEMQRMLNPPTTFWRCVHWVNRQVGYGLAVGAAAWAVGAPVSAYHFHQVAPWGWLNTLVLVIPVWLTLVLGLAKTVLTVLLPPLASVLGPPLAWVTAVLIWLVRLLARLPGSNGLAPTPPIWLIALMLTAYALWVFRPWLRISRATLGAFAAGVAIVTLWNLSPSAASDTLRLRVLSVGNGAACVLQLPNGRTLLYDLGAHPPYDLTRWTLGPLFAREHIYGIDALILSHPDLDHVCGVPDLLAGRSVATAITTPYFEDLPSGSGRRLNKDFAAQGVRVLHAAAGQCLSGTGDVRIEVLWPPPPEAVPILSSNDSSLVLRVSYAGRRILLCGDIQDLPQHALTAGGDIRSDVLLLPHHGSITRDTFDFVRAADPVYCIRSTGQPDEQMPPDLKRAIAGRKSLSTADAGAIDVWIAPGRFEVRSFRRAPQP
jgi:competence protein ComEC